MSFSETLDFILTEDQSQLPLQKAMEIVRKLNIAKQMVVDLQHRLLTAKNKINVELALNLRKRMPSLNIGIDKSGSCKVGYRSKSLTFSPDIENGIWIVQSSDPRFARRFQKLKRYDLIIGSSDITPLIDAVVEYFTGHYKSLGEEITGVGVILIEDKIRNLSDLIEWRNNQIDSTPLNSRTIKCLANA